MDSLFAKIIFLSSFLLASITGPSYIKIDQNDLSFNFKTGEVFPIYYYLNTQNIGPKKARFEISSDSDWISGFREGTSFTFVELPPQAYINFVLEIHPERLADGVNKAKVFIKVLDIDSLVSQELVLDETKVSVTLNKNFTPTPKVSPEISPEISPALTASPQPTILFSPALTPTPLIKVPTPLPKAISTPLKDSSGKISPVKSPSPVLFSQPEVPTSVLKQFQSVLESIKLFLKKLF